MMLRLQDLEDLLRFQFTTEWDSLSIEGKVDVVADLYALVRDEYNDDEDAIPEATAEYRSRIGRGNLASYAKCISPVNPS